MRALRLGSFKSEPTVEEVPEPVAGPGQVVLIGGGARLSVVVEELWRARALAEIDCAWASAGVAVKGTASATQAGMRNLFMRALLCSA